MANPNQPAARIFYADTRFEKLARRPGGVEREQALARAQAEIDELKPEFTKWLDSQLHELRATLSRSEDIPRNTALLEQAHASCAHLRDVGATMGFALITFVANNLCEILDAIKAGTIYDKDKIDCHIDALFLARTEQYCNLLPDQVPEMASGLRRVVELASVTLVPELK